MSNKKDSVVRDVMMQAKDDIVIPKLKEATNSMVGDIVYAIGDAITSSVTKLIFGKDTVAARTGTQRNPNSYSDISRRRQAPQQSIDSRSSQDLQYVCVESQQRAEQIKQEAIESIRRYGKWRVADLYESSGTVRTSFSDYQYGWVNESDIRYTRDRNGYWFNLPRPIQIKN